MLPIEITIRRAQMYRFLSDALLYPTDNWLEDVPALEPILRELESQDPPSSRGTLFLPEFYSLSLAELQLEYRRALGVTGSLCYETEYGLPHEFRQSQELADIAGFYNAFGFRVGGQVRERPDHLAMELEFMYVLAIKEAHAAAGNPGRADDASICADAQRKFLRDHLGRWVNLFAERVTKNTPDGVYQQLAAFAVAFVRADAERMGAEVQARSLTQVLPTPPPEDLVCGGCPVMEYAETAY